MTTDHIAMTPSQRAKGEAFLALHRGPRIIVLPNAWDVITAALLADAGFPAVATTSAGVAFALGYPDGQRIPRDEMLAVVARIAERVPLPITADMEAGYGVRPEDVAETVRRTIAAGAIGANIEDGIDHVLLDLSLGVERIVAAREAARATGGVFVLNARTDTYLARQRRPDVFDETVRRLNAYRRAGADCLFVPGVTDRETIGRLARAVDGPLNVMVGPGMPSASDLEALGVKRVSTGTSIARAALGLVRRAAAELRDRGTFGYAADALPYGEGNALLSR